MTANVSEVEKFYCKGDAISLNNKWIKWRRAFEIYLDAANIVTEKQKLASLLHSGGIDIQEIFYSFPNNTETSDGADNKVYKIAIKQFDNYFSPKQNFIYERHLFPQIKQHNKESFDKFLFRLKQQAAKCHFVNTDEHIIDQITDACNMEKLRQKILLLTNDEINLKNIIALGNNLEALNEQLNNFSVKKKKFNKRKRLELQKMLCVYDAEV